MQAGSSLFAVTSAGAVRSYKLPLNGDYTEIRTHGAPIAGVGLMYDDSLLFTVSEDCSLFAFDVQQDIKAGSLRELERLPFADEVMVTKIDLEEKRSRYSNSITVYCHEIQCLSSFFMWGCRYAPWFWQDMLRFACWTVNNQSLIKVWSKFCPRFQELETKYNEQVRQNQITIHIKDLETREKIKELCEKFALESERERQRYELLQQQKVEAEMEFHERLKAEEVCRFLALSSVVAW
jgi:cilia- and flagella-associated protein 57